MKMGIEPTKFNTSQRLADQVRLIFKKGWLSDQEILKICGQVDSEEHNQREFPKQIETQNIENRITIKPRNALILAEDETNIELI